MKRRAAASRVANKRLYRYALYWASGFLILSFCLTLLALWIHPTRAEFNLDLAKSFLQLGIVAVGTASIGLLVTWFAHNRGSIKENSDKRLDLLRRTRAAHVGTVHTRQILKADRSSATYREQMRNLMRIRSELEDIAEDVRVADGLFGNDNAQICCGLQCIIDFLGRGYAEHVDCAHIETDDEVQSGGEWLRDLTVRKEEMPPLYEIAVGMSKGRMRFHVFGTLQEDLDTVAIGEAFSFSYRSGLVLSVVQPKPYSSANEFEVTVINFTSNPVVGPSIELSATVGELNATVGADPTKEQRGDISSLSTKAIEPCKPVNVPFCIQVPAGTNGSLRIKLRDTSQGSSVVFRGQV